MPICPECNKEQTKRVKGACPGCGTPVSVYKGYWFRAEIGSPPQTILRTFEKLVTEKMRKDIPGFIFSIPKKGLSYGRELAACERMLSKAGYDLDVVLESLRILFTDHRFAWKTRASVTHLDKDYPLAVSMAKIILQEKRAKEKASMSAAEKVMSKEDIF